LKRSPNMVCSQSMSTRIRRSTPQRIMVVRINNYPHCVPFSIDGETIDLKTVYPSRRFRYLIEGERDGR
jgi:hypothetical protein